MKVNSENTNGKNFMPSVPAVLRMVFGDEFVGQLGDRLQAARHQAASARCRRSGTA